MTKSCGARHRLDEPAGVDGQLLARHPRHQHLGELARRQRRQVLAQRGRERRPDRLRPQRAVEQLRARLARPRAPPPAARAGRAPRSSCSRSVAAKRSCSCCARSSHGTPSNSRSSLLRGVSRRSSAPGRCSTTVRSRPTSLPTPWSSRSGRRYRNNGPLLVFLLRRLFFAAVVLLAVAIIVYGIYRFFRPDYYPGDSLFGGLGHDLERAFLHFDFGRACSHPGCPPVRALWARSWTADVYLLVGGLALGLGGGVAGAVFCANRPRSRATRVIESAGMLFYCLPVYLFGFGILLLFEPTFGAFPLPFFFDARRPACAPASRRASGTRARAARPRRRRTSARPPRRRRGRRCRRSRAAARRAAWRAR